MSLGNYNWQDFHSIAFDFDGIFTDNKVFVDEFGNESVRCDRGDGLAFDILRKFILLRNWDLKYFVISKEKNPVVIRRCEKLKIPCYGGVDNKKVFLKNYLKERFGDDLNAKKGLIYLGNDLNDLSSITFSGLSVAPCDAHNLVKEKVNFVLEEKGGNGFIRSFIEKFLNLDYKLLTEYNFFD